MKKIKISTNDEIYLNLPVEYWDENWKKKQTKDKKTEVEIDVRIMYNNITNKPMRYQGEEDYISFKMLKEMFHENKKIYIKVLENNEEQMEYELFTWNLIVFNCSHEKSPFVMDVKLKFKTCEDK